MKKQRMMFAQGVAPGEQMRGAATQAMSVYIVEERQRSRCPPGAAPLWAGGLQQNAN